MKTNNRLKKTICVLLAVCLLLPLAACSAGTVQVSPLPSPTEELNTSAFLVVTEDEPDTVDFQCTSIHYTIAQNVFNRLVGMENDADGNAEILERKVGAGTVKVFRGFKLTGSPDEDFARFKRDWATKLFK